jgi:tight adherence protein C
VSAAFAAACGLLIAAAAREIWADRGERTRLAARGRLRRLRSCLPGLSAEPAGDSVGSASRLRRAGVAGRVHPRDLVFIRAACAVVALPPALLAAPAAPGRIGPLVIIGVPAAAAVAPDLAIERRAGRRRAMINAQLADSLELIAVAAGAGNGLLALLTAARDAASGPLREELATTVAELECGVRHSLALERLGARSGPELAGLAVLLERSRRLGSPLAAGLQRQAAGLREERARELEEHAARAAPKIQLVVALLLVPSVLLLVAAAILAHADALTVGF